MLRLPSPSLTLSSLLLFACADADPDTTDPESAALPPSAAVSAPAPAPATELDAPDETPAPPLTLGEAGWQRSSVPSPAQPLLRIAEYDSYGPLAEQLSARILDDLEPTYACYEDRDPEARTHLELYYRVRVGDGADDGLTLDLHPRAAKLRACILAALLGADADVPSGADERSGLVVHLQLFPTAEAAPRLREPAPAEKTSERIGGTCWVWEDYPCAPNKACMADAWVRSACPARANE